jgi:hypothetical protein
MTSPQDQKQIPVLAYSSRYEEPLPPSASDVFVGLWWSFLAICDLGLGSLFVASAVASLNGPLTRQPSPIPLCCSGIVALFCLPTSFFLLRAARRSFSYKPRSHLPQTFTRRSSMAMAMAAAEAVSRNSKLDAAYLLLGILNAAPNTAVAVLPHLNVDVLALRTKLDNALGPRQQPLRKVVEPPAESSWLMQMIGRAIQQSQAQRLLYVGTEHLLVSLLAESSVVSQEMLKGLDAETLAGTIERLRSTLPNETLEEQAEGTR